MYHKLKTLAGVDEAGRGPLAGPVFAAAVIVDSENIIGGITDSKKISENIRKILYDKIISTYTYGIGVASVEEIEEMNILEATKLACERAVNNLPINPDIVLVDGNMKFHDSRYYSIIKGDILNYSISAASIVAKVSRDIFMQELDKEHPKYHWKKNKGYGTIDHISAIKNYGPTKHHRSSFLKNILKRES